MGKRTKGKCKYCGKEYTFSYMNRHLPVCEERQKWWEGKAGNRKCGYFELAICPKYGREHWLFIEMRETASLKDLDSFLRDIWLECCGHLSAFEIDGIQYESDAGYGDFGIWKNDETPNMDCSLKSVLRKGLTFGYEYDFGSTTELLITAVNYRVRNLQKEKFIILSRNNPIEYICESCEKAPARMLCTECYWEGRGFLCEECARTHECGEDMLLHICNSPRMGVCAYDGSSIFQDQFVPDGELPHMRPC